MTTARRMIRDLFMLPRTLRPSRRLTASSYAARRLRLRSFILGRLGRPDATEFSPASRVSISELLGGVADPCAPQ